MFCTYLNNFFIIYHRSLSSGSMLNSAGGRSYHLSQQRRTNYPDDISNQQRINSPVYNSINQLPFRNQERNQSCTNNR